MFFSRGELVVIRDNNTRLIPDGRRLHEGDVIIVLDDEIATSHRKILCMYGVRSISNESLSVYR